MVHKSFQHSIKCISDITIPQVLSSINSNSRETPKESDLEDNIISIRNNFAKSNTFEYDINGNIIFNNNLKNGNTNSLSKKEVKKAKTFNEDDVFQNNGNYNLHFNNGQNYLETVVETLNEMSNSKIDITGINENKHKDENNINNEIKIKINDADVKENKLKFQESENNGSSCMATLSGTNSKKNYIFPFK